MRKFIRGLGLMLMAGITIVMLSACNEVANPVGACAVITGNGKDGHDANVHGFIYSGQTGDVDSHEKAEYFPCGPRTYAVGTTSKNVSGQVAGDRTEPARGYTSKGTPVDVSLTAYWTPNQNKAALMDFTELCFKYSCFTGDPKGGSSNFGTEGWNGMLAENMGPSVNDTVLSVMEQFDDSIWEQHSKSQYDNLAEKLSAVFNDYARKRTGYNQDLFCGSGNSGWKDKKDPGKGDFTCSKVRFVVDGVVNADPAQQKQVTVKNDAERAKETNAARLNAAKELYGDDAGYWLGVQDSINACKNVESCAITIGQPFSR